MNQTVKYCAGFPISISYNDQSHNSLSNILLTVSSKGLTMTLHKISFQRSATDSSDITIYLLITPQIPQQLLNNTLQGTGQDTLNYLFTTTNHIFSKRL